jgi:hypothetical protein
MILMLPKTFTDQSLDPITINGSFDLFLGYRKTQSRPIQHPFTYDQGDTVIADAYIILEYLTEIFRPRQPG